MTTDHFARRHNVGAVTHDLGKWSNQSALVLERADIYYSIPEITSLIALRREISIAAVDCGTGRLKADC